MPICKALLLKFSFKMLRFIFLSIIFSMNTNLPGPKAEMHPQTITLPPPCFTVEFEMAGVLGCIDGTHVAIKRPVEHEERFYCRKYYHSLNVQLTCNSDMEIISVDASQGGATHEAFIWVNHPLKHHIEQFNGMWLLGDPGCALRKGMMTPIVNAPPNTL